MNPSLTIVEAALKLAGKLPGDVVEQTAQIISSHEATEARSRIADSIPHPHHRSLCLKFFNDWREKASGVSSAEVAIALRTAACSQRSREADQSVEIVWTGPRSEDVSFRHTEQAILQVLNSSQSRILLVSYAVYAIPNIQGAVGRAAKRGVKITVVVETPDKLDFCPFCTHSHQPIRLPRWYNGGGFEVPSRPGEEAIMFALPKAALPLFRSVAGACVLPTAKRLLTLMVGAILATGRRTITNLLRAVGGLAPGHPSSYHRVFSRRRWSLWPLAHGLADLILRHWVPEGSVTLAGDDTVDEHRGAHVYGKGRHRDPVRSTHSYTAYRWGHKWVVLAILVRFPFAKRPWALPVLVALYRSREWNQQHRRRHRTPAQLLRRLVAVLLHWFPHRHFTLTGDGGYGSHEMARFAHRHRRRLTLVSRFVPDAQLYTPPPVIAGKRPAHRPRTKGEKLPTPEATVAATGPADRTACNVSWYGGGRRDIEVVTATGNWYHSGEGLVPLRWVFVRDRTGTHRDDYLFSTDPEMATAPVVETYTGRWSIETTLQEMRAYLGLETTRGWKEATVLRLAPCLFGLFSVVAVLYDLLPVRARAAGRVAWPGKVETTFSDATTAVRRWLWVNWVFANHGYGAAFSKLSRPFQEALLSALAPPA